MSCSTYTYRDYAMEYSHTEDIKSWMPVYLNSSLSLKILGFEDGIAALTENPNRNPLEDDHSECDSVISSPRSPSFPEMTMDMVEECLMEPLVIIDDECAPHFVTNGFIPTVKAITNGDDSTVLVSASTYGIKNIMFKITGCVLCVNETDISLYMPLNLLRKTRDDLHAQSYSCKINNSTEQDVFHRVKVPARLTETCKSVYDQSTPKRTTRSHTPLLKDGFSRYCNVDLIISICLTPSRTTDASSFDGTMIVQHGKRLIDAVVLDIEY